MSYIFQPMTQEQAENIAYHWHYEEPYSFYNMEADMEDLEEFVEPLARGDKYYAVMEKKKLIGFFSYTCTAPGEIDIGLGMHPDLTGKGKGAIFLEAGMQYAIQEYQPTSITLSVAAFNKRAIAVYKRLGFQEIKTFTQNTNGGSYEFVKMIYETAKE